MLLDGEWRRGTSSGVLDVRRGRGLRGEGATRVVLDARAGRPVSYRKAPVGVR